MNENSVQETPEIYGPAAPPSGRLTVKRGGHSITRQIPKPIVLVDTREQLPFNFSRFPALRCRVTVCPALMLFPFGEEGKIRVRLLVEAILVFTTLPKENA